MIKCNDWPVGVCTWSLGNDFDSISALRKETNLNHIHLAVSPALDNNGKNYLSKVQNDAWKVTATMIDFPQEDYSSLESIRTTGGVVPDDCWQDNKKRIIDAIDITAQLGVRYLEFHLGFLNDTNAGKLRDRAGLLADTAGKRQIILLMETGQETAGQLCQFLEELSHPSIGVNFDPANMILYDKGNPIEAVHTLAPWIKHVHIKDALRPQRPGTWGIETAWGNGQVNPQAFLTALKQVGFAGALAIERESGNTRFEDIKLAAEVLANFSQ